MANKPIVTMLDHGKLLKYMTLDENDKITPYFKVKKTSIPGKWYPMEPPEIKDLFKPGPIHKGKYCTSAELQDIMDDEEYTKTLTDGAWIYVTDTSDLYMWDIDDQQWYLQ